MMNKRVKVAKSYEEQNPTFGGSSSVTKYEILGTFWMAQTFSKGVKALHEGALDAYDTVMFRCRYNANIDRWCLLKYNGKWYQITSFNEDYQDNQIQMTAVELANQQVNIVEPTPEPEPTPTPDTPDEPTENTVNPEQGNDGTINDNDNGNNS